MSLFDADDEEAKGSISFFNSLTEEERALIVSDLNPNTFKLPRYYEDLAYLLSLIQQDITRHDGIRIGNRLMELGLDETWARLLVANIKNDAPTVDYQVGQLNRIDEKKFAATIGKIMDALRVEKMPDEEVIEKFGIGMEQVNCIADMSSRFMQDVTRGGRHAFHDQDPRCKEGPLRQAGRNASARRGRPRGRLVQAAALPQHAGKLLRHSGGQGAERRHTGDAPRRVGAAQGAKVGPQHAVVAARDPAARAPRGFGANPADAASG